MDWLGIGIKVDFFEVARWAKELWIKYKKGKIDDNIIKKVPSLEKLDKLGFNEEDIFPEYIETKSSIERSCSNKKEDDVYYSLVEDYFDIIVEGMQQKLDNSETQDEMNFISGNIFDILMRKIDSMERSIIDSGGLAEESFDLFMIECNSWRSYVEIRARLSSSFYKGGSIYPLVYASEKSSMAWDRIIFLKELEEQMNI